MSFCPHVPPALTPCFNPPAAFGSKRVRTFHFLFPVSKPPGFWPSSELLWTEPGSLTDSILSSLWARPDRTRPDRTFQVQTVTVRFMFLHQGPVLLMSWEDWTIMRPTDRHQNRSDPQTRTRRGLPVVDHSWVPGFCQNHLPGVQVPGGPQTSTRLPSIKQLSVPPGHGSDPLQVQDLKVRPASPGSDPSWDQK